jgi:pumilio RNA-binding family
LEVGPSQPPSYQTLNTFYLDYVLQRAVVVADPDQREQLITHIRAQIPTMRRYSSAYNKHLLSSEYRLSGACDRHSWALIFLVERLLEKYDSL